MSTPVIDIRDVYFAYHKTWVLEEVNLSIEDKDFVAIIGPNGGGKTTLIKLILGLLLPSQGHIRVLGRPAHKAAPDIGYVPQDTEVNRSVPLTVQHTVRMGRMRGCGGWRRFTARDERKTQEALERVGAWNLRQELVGNLSGGQRQRIMLARALVSDPQVLLLDEPTASVDTQGQTEFFDFLKELNQKVTILVVSHDLMVLSSYIKSIACVSRQVYFHDQPEITKDMLSQAYHCPVELIAHGQLPHRVLANHE